MAREALTRVLAVLFPPLAVLSSAHELYLRNQSDLDGTLSVLHPFWAAAAAAAVLALVLQRAERFAPARVALAGCYTAGLAFVAWSFLRALPAGAYFVRWLLDTAPGAALFAAAWIAATVALGRAGPRRLEPLLALLAVILAGREAAAFATRSDSRPKPPPDDLAAAFGAGGDPARPNVYHLLLDSLPDEILEASWPRAEESLRGFVRFRARAPQRSTIAVLPAIFSGRWLLPDGPVEAAVREALSGEPAFLRDLERAGYRSLAFVPRFAYQKEAAAFDLAVFHGQNLQEPDLAGLHAAVFLRLWLLGTLPSAVVEPLVGGRLFGLGADFFRMTDVPRLSSHAQPIIARLSMESILELEPRLPARGRYTLVHLLIPHLPYLLEADCSHGGTAMAPTTTDLRRQTECSLRLVDRFLDTLRRLDRLDGSVVLVHGDHGSGEVLEGGRLVADDGAWLRTALLVKAVGSRGPLRRAAEPAELVDIAPTLLRLLGLPRRDRFDGRVLEEALPR